MHLQSIDYPTLGVKPRIIPVVSTKGGEGKSTQSANLAGFLADAVYSRLNMKPLVVCTNC